MDWECRLVGTKFRSIVALALPHSSTRIYETAHNKHPKQELLMLPPAAAAVVAACCWRLLELHNKPAMQDRCFAPNSGHRRYRSNC